MRVTDNLRLSTIQRSLARLSSDQADAAQQVSTGLRLNKASDDPLAAAYVTRIRDALQQSETYRKNISLLRSDTDLTEGSLAQSIELLNQSRELALQGANDTQTPANRQMLADQVVSLREQLLSLSNAQGSAGYLFAGNKTKTPPFSDTGVYQGDGAVRRIEVGPGVILDAGLTGGNAFVNASGINVFQALDDLSAALRSDDSAQISATLGGLDQSLQQLTLARSQTGLITNRLDTADATLEQTQLSLTKREGDLSNADAFESISKMTQLNSVLEQAIAVARTTLNTSLQRF